MTPVLGAEVWHHWLGLILFLSIVGALVITGVLYVYAVSAKKFPKQPD
jgi:hypothetical protein